MIFHDNDLILFQGDSITDCGRSRTDGASLGNGYAMMAASWLSAMVPGKRLRFLNRGISGNRAKDLRARWQADCLDLKPNWVSILIGVNDTWRRFDSNDATPMEVYETHYRQILQQSKTAGHKLIVCEPFLLPVPQDRVAWREDLDPKIAAARRLAREFGVIYVPLDGAFAAAATQQSMEVWAPDGVHPTPTGHALIAQTWLRAVQALA